VPDQKPPRLAAGALETLLALLQYQRDSLVRKVAGLDDAAAWRSMVDSGTSLLWLVKHMAGAESPGCCVASRARTSSSRNDTPQPGDNLDAAIQLYRATWAIVDGRTGR
jgi:hypothetical protein